jgi:hypothetical protein
VTEWLPDKIVYVLHTVVYVWNSEVDGWKLKLRTPKYEAAKLNCAPLVFGWLVLLFARVIELYQQVMWVCVTQGAVQPVFFSVSNCIYRHIWAHFPRNGMMYVWEREWQLPVTSLCTSPHVRIRGSVVGVATRLRGGRFGIRIPRGTRDFSFLLNVQTRYGPLPTSCSLGTVGKAAGAWS